jgi:hypothetical protein
LPASWRRSRPRPGVSAAGAAIAGRDLGLTILLTAMGFLAVGIALLARLWRDRHRFTPLGI